MNGTIVRAAGKLLGGVLLLGLAAPGRAATVEYIHTDALGSPVAVTDSSGAVIERREYEPYGRQLAPTSVADGPGYAGHVSDAATGLDYMQQRYYDPFLGRFLSVDDITVSEGNFRHFNRYSYAYNNPYKFTDPDGRCPICVTAGVGALVGAVVGGGVELYKQSRGGGKIDWRSVGVETGRGAIVGALAGVGAGGAGALAVSAGATSTGVAAVEVAGGAYGTGLGTFATGPASDLAKGAPERPIEAHGKDAVNAAAGALAGGAAGKAVGGALGRTNASSSAAGTIARAAEEGVSTAVSNSLPQPKPQEQLRK